MTKNTLGGIAALVALGAIFYFTFQTNTPAIAPTPIALPAPAVVKPAVKPAPVPVPVPTPKPDVKIEPKATKPTLADIKITFHRVEHGGKQGAAVECREVKAFADGKSPAELAVLAKQYGVTESDLKRYFVCIN